MAVSYTHLDVYKRQVIDHAEDITLTKNGHMHEGIVSYELGVIGRPAVAEDLAVARDILLSEMTGGHIHIAHVSSKNTVDMVRRAKAKGLNVTCEVTSQHLSFTDEYLREYNPAFKMAPPIRSEEDVYKRQHVRASKANKIYIANVMTQPGETTGYTLSDHVEALIAHGGEGIVAVSYTHLDVYKRQL